MASTGTDAEARVLLLFDGSALAYRAHFAMARSGLSSSEGVPTGATYGFASDVHRVLGSLRPAFAAMVFDTKEPTFRHVRYPEYKATRERMPDELVDQLPYIRKATEVLGLPWLAKPGFEADDLIGTLARSAADEGLEVVIVTGDKDLMQVVDDRVRLMNLSRRGDGPAEVGPAEVEAKFGVPPERVIDVLALMGDSSDNVPGVPGIGPKGAAKLVADLGTVEDILEKIPQAGSKRIQDALTEHRDLALLSKELVTIDCQVPMDVSLDDLAWEGPRVKEAVAFFRRLDFRTLAEEMHALLAPEAAEAGQDYRVVGTQAELESLVRQLEQWDFWALDTETTGLNPLVAEVVGLSFSGSAGAAWYVPLNLTPPLLDDEPGDRRGQAVIEFLRPVLEDAAPRKCGQNVKYDQLVLRKYGIDLAGLATDTMVASYLVEPHQRARSLDALALRHFNFTKIKTEELIGKGKDQITMDLLPVADVGEYACEDADFTFRLAQKFRPQLDEEGLRKLHDEIEIPLIRVLADMEESGVRVDRDALKAMARELEKEVDVVQATIFEMAGTEQININSPKQLGQLLFEELKIHEAAGYKPRRTKTGWATGQEVLEALSDHPLPSRILEFRGLSKLLNTYVRPLPDLVDPETGHIHASFNQTVAATGRLSSSNPNLQNIPIRTATGRRIREAFLPSSDEHLLLSADYSQIELRIMAHLCEDENLIGAFQQGADIHRDTAARIFDVEPEQVDGTLRGRAKAINFGILYGMGPQRLSRETGLALQEAKDFIARYFQAFPSVRDFLEGLKDRVRDCGFAQTIMGRRRRIPDIHSSNGMLRSAAENMAVNTPVQGSAADILKVAMVAIHGELARRGSGTRMILTVHDELVFDVPGSELEAVQALVVREMEQAWPMRVPLKVDVGSGRNWLEAH